MKTSLRLTLALAALFSVRLAAEQTAADQPRPRNLIDRLTPLAFSKDPRLDMVVVAEKTPESATLVQPTPDLPAYYVAYDAGYREMGDPVANENPPTASEMARALRRTLAAEGYRPATVQAPPSLLLIYHWGALNKDSLAIRSSLQIEPNLKARLSLVAGRKYAPAIEDDILQRRISRDMHTNFPPPFLLSSQARELRELAQDDRYFVIVSAYDYAALGRHETRLLWRTKMSASHAGVAISAALPALLKGGGHYFGRDTDEPQFVETPVGPRGKVEIGTPTVVEFPDVPGAAGRLDDPYIRELAEKDRAEVSGARPGATSGGPSRSLPDSAAPSS